MPKGIEAKTFPDARTNASADAPSTKSNNQPLSVVATYENFRNHILHGRYEEAFGRDALQQLTVATQDDSLLAVDDVDAPLVTITKEDFSDLVMPHR